MCPVFQQTVCISLSICPLILARYTIHILLQHLRQGRGPVDEQTLALLLRLVERATSSGYEKSALRVVEDMMQVLY